jgi:Ca2+-binding EF-hand superfamily protein
VAEQLVLLDRWEVSIAQALDRPDVSQKGNMSHVRNEKFQELPILGSHSMMEWQLPEWDSLEFDYVSGKRMPSGTKRLDTESFKLAMVAAQQAGCDESWQVLAFRKVSHHIKLSAKQLRQLLSIFPSIYARQDIFVTFYSRITDIVNEKVCRVRFDDRIEVPEMRQRLGHMTFFPFIQPEQAYFEFELAHYDGRLALAQLLTLAAKESRMQVTNIHDYEWKHADGKVDPMPTGIPPGWSFVDRVPLEGIFKCTYNCAPEDRDLHARKYLLEHFGFWSNSAVEKEKVNWWATIRGTPNDVCEFLYFLVMRYKHVWEAFTVMDGICGNKQICYKEFEEGYEKSGCKKFKGKNKSQRIHNVFRYLDPSGEGTVSEQEWELLDELFKEITFSVREFVWFLDRTFENLDDAWVFLDQDGNDVLDFQEFTIACEKIGYFGHAKSIFSFLDKDGEGTISFEEFQVVQNYSEKAENLREDFHEP